jgi:serine/threonine-protein kinase
VDARESRNVDEVIGHTVAGRYHVLRRVGHGGAGDVYAALDLQLKRQVAIKIVRLQVGVLSPQAAAAQDSAIFHEAQTQARLSHPNIAAIFDVGRDESGDTREIFLAMELVPGESLRRWLAGSKKSWRQIVELFAAAARGLAAAHRGGVFHRDFKPENVVVDEKGRPTIVDFGIALTRDTVDLSSATFEPKEEAGTMTITSSGRSGTPGYLAPEYVDDGLFDARSDQFAFAVALYESLFGQRPFSHLKPGSAREQVRHGISFPQAPEKTPRWLQQMLSRSLCADPEDRFSDMESLADFMEASLAAADSRKQRTRMGVFGVFLPVALLLGVMSYWPSSTGSRCEEKSSVAENLWSPEVGNKVELAFRAAGDDGVAYGLVKAKMETHLESLRDAHFRVCQSISHGIEHLHETSHIDLDAVSRCLGEIRAKTQGFIVGLKKADASTVREAPRAASALEDPSACFEQQASRANEVQAIEAKLSPGARTKIEAIRTELHELEGRADIAPNREILELLPPLLNAADASPSDALRAEVYSFAGTRQVHANNFARASAWLHRSLHYAIKTGHARVAIASLARLLRIHGYQLQDYDFAHEIARALKAWHQRADSPPRWGIEAESELGTAAAGERDFLRALSHYQNALDLARHALPAGHPRHAVQHVNVAFALIYLSESRAAQNWLYRARDLALQSLGDANPILVLIYHNIAVTHFNLGEVELAVENAKRSIELCQRRETDILLCGPTEAIVAEMLIDLGRSREAIAHLEALETLQDERGRRGPAHAFWAHESLVTRWMERGEHAKARAVLERGLKLARGEEGAPVDFVAGLEISQLALRDRLDANRPSDDEILATVARYRHQTLYGIHTESRMLDGAALILLRRHSAALAEPLLRSLVAELQTEFSADAMRLRWPKLLLVSALRQQGKLAQAIEVWEEAKFDRESDEHAQTLCTTTLWSKAESARLWLARGRSDEALKRSQSAIACLEANDGHPTQIAEYLYLRARAEAARDGHWSDASRALARRAYETYAHWPGFAIEMQEVAASVNAKQ